MDRPTHKQDWKETKLWTTLSALESEDAQTARKLLAEDRCMPAIQHVLDQGGTGLLDFTLHDAAHAFRVAERMAEVVPPGVLPKLSGYELALLLLSAYLHDIGMTPERTKVSTHRDFLITGARGALTDAEVNAFQRWLDEDERGIEPPLSKGRTTTEELQLADELVMYYCRERHNDWSKEWIERHLERLAPALYPGWTKDLVTLCCSHHEGYAELRGERFEPALKGPRNVPVQLRYLACVLRVADILEFDPERTPEVIFQHREIAAKSRIFWAKDHAIGFSLTRDASRSTAHIAIAARPKDAYLHRAIEQTVDGVNAELETCRRLAEETHFEKCPHHPLELPHRWDLPVSITPDIRPMPCTYDYIDGAFRPNVSKVLALLSGGELYKDPIVAVRELLQNAFDAVREKIARERLELQDPLADEDVQPLRRRHEVALSVESQDGEVWLVCKDNGVGMTKAIIRDNLLVSGASRRHDLIDLERKCKAKGFSVERTGQFGIGVLSYFMLADRMVLKTCRDGNIGESREGGWQFETEGLGRFGELRALPPGKPGTEVRLRLRREVVGESVEAWVRRGEEYLRETLVYLPCRFSLSAFGRVLWNLLPGWAATDAKLAELVFRNFEDSMFRLQSKPRLRWGLTIEMRETSSQELEQIKQDAARCLKWLRRDVELPDALGRARVHLPYFELPGGNSLGYLHVKASERGWMLQGLQRKDGLLPGRLSLFAWKGMAVHSPIKDRQSVSAEVDLVGRASTWVDVGRTHIKTTGSIQKQVQEFIGETYRGLLREFLNANNVSLYAVLNRQIAGMRISSASPLYWVHQVGDERRWENVVFPVATSAGTWNGRRVSCPDRAVIGAVVLGAREWHSNLHSPDRIVLHGRAGIKLPKPCGLWLDRPAKHSHSALGRRRLVSDFPSSWVRVFRANLETGLPSAGFIIYNRAHPIIKAVDAESLRWIDQVHESQEPRPREDICSSLAHAAAWLFYIFSDAMRGRGDWLELWEHDPELVSAVWKLVLGTPDTPLYLWDQHGSMNIVRPGYWEGGPISRLMRGPNPELSDPGPEWWLMPSEQET